MRLAAVVFLVAGLCSSCGTDDTPTLASAAAPTSSSSTSSSSTSTTAATIAPTTTPPTPTPPPVPTSERRRASRSVPQGRSGTLAAGSLGSFVATCYALTGTTASGSQAGPGSIAVDPRVIPLGTRLRVEAYGEGVAADTGGAIKGRRIDVWKSSSSACMAWGRRSVLVEVLGEGS